MLDDLSSAQNSNWIYSPQQLKECRERANREAAVHVRALSAGLTRLLLRMERQHRR